MHVTLKAGANKSKNAMFKRSRPVIIAVLAYLLVVYTSSASDEDRAG